MKKKILAVLLAAAAVFGMAGSREPIAEAQAAAASGIRLAVGEDTETQVVLTPGKSTEVRIPLRALEGYVFEPEFEIEVAENAPFEIGKTELYQIIGGEYYKEYITISSVADTYLHFTVNTKENAKIGKYEIRIKCVNYESNITAGEGEEVKTPNDIVLTGIVTQEKMPAELAISALSVSGVLEPGSTATVSFTVTNSGELEAKNVRLSADYSGGELLPNYTEYTKNLGDMKKNASKRISLPVKVLETVNRNVVQLPLKITYKDNEGNSYEADANNVLYLEVKLPEDEEKFENGTLLVNNVKQSPAKPKAGETVSITFDMQNTGERDYTDTKLYIDYVSNHGFEPVNAEPYQFVGTIRAGQKKSVTVQAIAGKDIAAGMNTLGISYTYLDGNGKEAADQVELYVLNVQSGEDTAISKPKLMVSEFSTSLEQIKTGEAFDFVFQVYNTHNDIAAKNIKVTVTSETFSVTKGSNSFFLQQVKAGESAPITINLKASAAATTGSYPIHIQMEYEYDGMPTKETGDEGVVVTETKMLLIKENLRVSVENVSIGGWETPMANQTTALSFSIYNMGKSTLNNVYFTVEGDFEVANGSSYYYGSLQAGYPDYVEMDVIPLVEGEAKGTLTIHMEDSNGDEETYVSDIGVYVMETTSPENPWMGGDDDQMGEFGSDVPVDVSPVEKPAAEPLLSRTVYIGLLVVAFLVGLFVTRGIRIASYKRKLRKEE